MKIAACDPEAFYPLRSLVNGPLHSMDDLGAVERFIRTVVLHDEIVMDAAPFPYDPEVDTEFTDEEKRVGSRPVIVAIAPVLTGFDFFNDMRETGPIPEINLSPALIELAGRFSNANEGNVYFRAHVDYLKRMLGIVENGGSVLLCDEFGQRAIQTSRQYPEKLFSQLDEDWNKYAQELEHNGLDLLVPPVLGIVLTRCARRDAIPGVIRDLRDEWLGARRKVWDLLDALKESHTLQEARELQREITEASLLFSPKKTDADTRPVRVLWEFLSAAGAGFTTATLSGGNPVVGAATNALGQIARSGPALIQEFGPAIFGRGAFDLARRVRRETAQIELNSLTHLLSESEKEKLGLG